MARRSGLLVAGAASGAGAGLFGSLMDDRVAAAFAIGDVVGVVAPAALSAPLESLVTAGAGGVVVVELHMAGTVDVGEVMASTSLPIEMNRLPLISSRFC